MEKNQPIIQIDTEGFPQKPSKNEYGFMRGRFRNCKAMPVQIQDLVSAIETGHTIYPVIADGIKASNWKGQNLFCVDIDNAMDGTMLTEKDLLKICDNFGIKPLLIYPTFSHTTECPKYRLLFHCGEIITEENKRKSIIETIVRLFPQADPVCTNADRIFLGTNKKVCYTDENATFSFEDIIRINGELPPAIKSVDKVTDKASNDNNNLLYAEIKKYDFYTLLEMECDGITHQGSNYTMFYKCPLCKGHDDLVLYHDNNTYTCFGSGETGNIITYLTKTRGVTKSDAVKYFLHDMCGYTFDQFSSKNTQISNSIEINEQVKFILEKLKKMDKKPELYSQDDKGMGELFALVTKNKLKYNVDRKTWMYYNGKVWVNDNGSATVNKYAKHFTDALIYYTKKSPCGETFHLLPADYFTYDKG